MAGGIDWFRWHHGSANNPKFRLVAKRADARVSEVLATWACLLETASAAEDRGNAGAPDFEALDLALDMADGTAARIYARMCEREIIDAESGRVIAWERRQPKRERPEDNSAERVRAHRAKARQDAPNEQTESQETPCNAMQHQETPRVEESRVEESNSKDTETIVSGPVDEKPVNGHPVESKFPNCPQTRIVALYRERFPSACHPRQWDGANAVQLASRWRETCKRLDFTSEAQGVEYFETLFSAVEQSDFLMGRTNSQGRQPFRLRLAWLVKKANFEKIVEGFYS